jgi:hypothetical protein
MAEPSKVTVLLGDKPLNLAPPISYRRDIQTQHVEDIAPNGRPYQADFVTSDRYQIFSGTRLVAVSNSWSLTRDDETGDMTLRLSEDGTVLC